MKITETNLRFSSNLKPRRLTQRVIIHHSASQDVPAATIHQWHLNHGWAGIGYHFIIRANGQIERGRPEHTIGAHAGAAGNSNSIGICLTGNFETGKPTGAQINSLVWLLKEYLFPKYGELAVIGHKDVMATACPGRNFPWEELRDKLKEGNNNMTTVKVLVYDKVLEGKLINGKTYVYIREIIDALTPKVVWDEKNKTVIVK